MGNLGTQINTDLCRAMARIVTGGWANLSDGNVESPTGHFAVITIEPSERAELLDAFEGELEASPYPGSYLLVEDSDGNKTVTEYLTHTSAMGEFARLQQSYGEWVDHEEAVEALRPSAISTIPDPRDEKQYLVCAVCGEAFDDFKIAAAHQYNSTCNSGHDGQWHILPESEAL